MFNVLLFSRLCLPLHVQVYTKYEEEQKSQYIVCNDDFPNKNMYNSRRLRRTPTISFYFPGFSFSSNVYNEREQTAKLPRAYTRHELPTQLKYDFFSYSLFNDGICA